MPSAIAPMPATRATPVVASDLEGLRDAIVPGVTGLLVAPGDAEAWAQQIAGLLRDTDALGRLGWQFRDAAIERYGEPAMAARLRAILFDGDAVLEP